MSCNRVNISVDAKVSIVQYCSAFVKWFSSDRDSWWSENPAKIFRSPIPKMHSAELKSLSDNLLVPTLSARSHPRTTTLHL